MLRKPKPSLRLTWFIATAFVLALAPALTLADGAKQPDRLEAATEVGFDDRSKLEAAYAKHKAVLDTAARGGVKPGGPGWDKIEKAVAEIYVVCTPAKAPKLLKAMLRTEGAGALDGLHGQIMWQARRAWYEQAVDEICLEHKLSLGSIDSGTEGSVANDTDKTNRLLGQLGRPPLTIGEINAAITKRVSEIVERRTGIKGISVEHLDTELFTGDAFYPSWREAHTAAIFKVKANEVLATLGKNPFAYITNAAQKMQVIRRAEEKRLALGEDPKAVGEAVIVRRYDPKTGTLIKEYPENWIEVMGLPGELVAHDAAGSALGQLLFQNVYCDKARKHPGAFDDVKDDIAKYHTRAFLDTQTIRDPQRREARERFTMDDFNDPLKRLRLVQDICGIDMADANEVDRRSQYELTLQISAELMANKDLRAANRAGEQKSVDAIMEPLARALATTNANFTADRAHWLKKAREAYVDVSEQASLRVLAHNFPEAVETWLRPDSAHIASAEKIEPGVNNENIRLDAMVLIVTAIDNLPPKQLEVVLNRVPDEHRIDVENLVRMRAEQHARTKREARDRRRRLQNLTVAVRRRVRKLVRRVAKTPEQRKRLYALTSFATVEAGLQRIRDTGSVVRGEVRRWQLQRQIKHISGFTTTTERDRAIGVLARTFGHVDAAFSVLEAYQSGEGKSESERRAAVTRAVLEQVANELPYLGDALDIWQSVESRNVQAFTEATVPMVEAFLFERGFAAARLAGPVVMYVGFARTLVSVLGHEIFYPLRQDAIDVVYRGYIPNSPGGMLRAGNRFADGYKPSRHTPILAHVPVRFAVLQGELLDKLLADPQVPQTARIALSNEPSLRGDENDAVIVDMETDYPTLIADLSGRLGQLAMATDDLEEQLYRRELMGEIGQVLQVWDRQAAIAQALKALLVRKRDPTLLELEVALELKRQNLYRTMVKEVHSRYLDDPKVDDRRIPEVRYGELGREARAEGEERDQLRTATRERFAAERARLDADYAEVRRALWNLRGESMAEVAEQRAALEARSRELDKQRAALRQRMSRDVQSYLAQLTEKQGTRNLILRGIEARELTAIEDECEERLRQWIFAEGEFAADDLNAVLEKQWSDKTFRKEMVARLSRDYLASRQLTLAGEAGAKAIAGLLEKAEAQALERSLDRLELVYRRALAEPNARRLIARALALAPDAGRPRVRVQASMLRGKESVDDELLVEASVYGVPVELEEDWEARLKLERIDDPSALPERERRYLQRALGEGGKPIRIRVEVYRNSEGYVRGATHVRHKSAAKSARKATAAPAGATANAPFATGETYVVEAQETKMPEGLALQLASLRYELKRFVHDPEAMRPPNMLLVQCGGETTRGELRARGLELASYRHDDPNLNFAGRDVRAGAALRSDYQKMASVRSAFAGDVVFNVPETIEVGKPFEVGCQLSGHLRLDYKAISSQSPEAYVISRSVVQLGDSGFGQGLGGTSLVSEQRVALAAEASDVVSVSHAPRAAYIFNEEASDLRALRVRSATQRIAFAYDISALDGTLKAQRGNELVERDAAQLKLRWDLRPDADVTPTPGVDHVVRGELKLTGLVSVAVDGLAKGSARVVQVQWAAVYYGSENAIAQWEEYAAGSRSAPEFPALAAGGPNAGDSSGGGSQPGAGDNHGWGKPPGGQRPGTAGGTGAGSSNPWQAGIDQAHGGGSNKPMSPQEVAALLASPTAWQNARVQALIDEWLGRAVPSQVPEGSKTTWRYDTWARAYDGVGVLRPVQPPTTTKVRHSYLWDMATDLGSKQHYTLREYVERRLRGDSGVHAATGGGNAWAQSFEEGQRRARDEREQQEQARIDRERREREQAEEQARIDREQRDEQARLEAERRERAQREQAARAERERREREQREQQEREQHLRRHDRFIGTWVNASARIPTDGSVKKLFIARMTIRKLGEASFDISSIEMIALDDRGRILGRQNGSFGGVKPAGDALRFSHSQKFQQGQVSGRTSETWTMTLLSADRMELRLLSRTRDSTMSPSRKDDVLQLRWLLNRAKK